MYRMNVCGECPKTFAPVLASPPMSGASCRERAPKTMMGDTMLFHNLVVTKLCLESSSARLLDGQPCPLALERGSETTGAIRTFVSRSPFHRIVKPTFAR